MTPRESEQRLADYVGHMLDAVRLARAHVEGMSKGAFLRDKRTQQAVILNILIVGLIVGEAATKIAQNHKHFAASHPQVPWQSMRGMRNKMAHGYFDIDLDIVWETVQRNLPELQQQLTAISKAVDAE